MRKAGEMGLDWLLHLDVDEVRNWLYHLLSTGVMRKVFSARSFPTSVLIPGTRYCFCRFILPSCFCRLAFFQVTP